MFRHNVLALIGAAILVLPMMFSASTVTAADAGWPVDARMAPDRGQVTEALHSSPVMFIENAGRVRGGDSSLDITAYAPYTANGLAESPWPMWLHDPQHTGRSSHVGPQTNNVKWTIDLESVWIPSAPAVAQDGTVYLVTSQGLYAIHPSGQSLWVYEPSHTPWGRGTPAIGHNGAIYVTRSGGLSAINPDGSLEWDATVAVDYDSVQLVLDQQGTLYYAAGCVLPSDEQVHPCLIAFDPGGDVSWVYDLENGVTYQQPDFSLAPEGSLGSSSPGLTTSPTIGHNGVIYIGYGQTLFAINADGTEEWRKTFLDVARDDGIVTPSIGSDGTIYVIVKCAERADECKDYKHLTKNSLHI